MATLHTYRCKGCGFEIVADPRGFMGTMMGQYYNFKCTNCENIVDLSARDLYEMTYFPECPKCGDRKHLSTWNPEEGRCPKCNGEMECMNDVIFAD